MKWKKVSSSDEVPMGGIWTHNPDEATMYMYLRVRKEDVSVALQHFDCVGVCITEARSAIYGFTDKSTNNIFVLVED